MNTEDTTGKRLGSTYSDEVNDSHHDAHDHEMDDDDLEHDVEYPSSNFNAMMNLQLVHTFLKDPMTDKLVRRYVRSPKARRAITTSVHVVEILMVAMPLIDTAVKGVR